MSTHLLEMNQNQPFFGPATITSSNRPEQIEIEMKGCSTNVCFVFLLSEITAAHSLKGEVRGFIISWQYIWLQRQETD